MEKIESKKQEVGHLKSFKIIFGKELIQISYDTSFEEFNSLTIDSLIKDTLHKLNAFPLNPFEYNTKDYILYCSCGESLKRNQLLSKLTCSHYKDKDYDKERDKDMSYLLIKNSEIQYEEKNYTDENISDILMKITDSTNKESIVNFMPKKFKKKYKISENLKDIFILYDKKLSRGIKIKKLDLPLFYKNEDLKYLINKGIIKDRAIISLRLQNGNLQKAEEYARNENNILMFKNDLKWENSEILSEEEYNKLCQNEIKKEYPDLEEEKEIIERMNEVNKKIKNSINQKRRDIDSDDEEGDYDSEEEPSSNLTLNSIIQNIFSYINQ